MICPNCGKVLAEGEICSCQQVNDQPVTSEQTYAPVNETPAYDQPQPQTEGYYQESAPNQSYGTYYDPNVNQQQNYYGPVPPVQTPYYAPAPENQPARTDYPAGYKVRKKYVAVILAWSLGVFGIHNFYLGNSSKALAQVLLATVGALFFGIGPAVAAVWALVESVQILTESIDKDANGYKIQTLEESIAKTLNKD